MDVLQLELNVMKMEQNMNILNNVHLKSFFLVSEVFKLAFFVSFFNYVMFEIFYVWLFFTVLKKIKFLKIFLSSGMQGKGKKYEGKC